MKASKILIPGSAGELEAVFTSPVGRQAGPVAVVCHPHPLHGGSMSNKVVHILAKTLLAMNIPVLVFNFRGVGRSQGQFDNGVGEGEDLLAAVSWLNQRYPDSEIWLAGFSFGAIIALQQHRQAGASRLIIVAPPVLMYDVSDIAEVEIPWMVIQGGEDEITDPTAVRAWLDSLSSKPELVWLEDAGHFFHGRLNRLGEAVLSSWGSETD